MAAARLADLAVALGAALAVLEQPATAVILASLGRDSRAAIEALRARERPPAPDPAWARSEVGGMTGWLAGRGLAGETGLGAGLAAAGIGVAELESLGGELDADSLARLLEWLPARLLADRLPAAIAAEAASLARRLQAGTE